MSRRILLVGAALLLGVASLAPFARGADAPREPVTLEGPPAIEFWDIADVDGDGVVDLLASHGREVRGWRGGAIRSAPTWTFTVPAEATYVGISPGPTRPALLGIAKDGVVRFAPGGPPTPVEGLRAEVPWTDAGRSVLAGFAGAGGVLLPTASGFRWIPDLGAPGRGFDIAVPPARRVVAAGPFLEDAATATATWPQPWFGRGAEAKTVWFAAEDALRSFRIEGNDTIARTIRTDFLPRDSSTRTVLEDLDADGRPDLVHEATTNDTGVYSFFRTPAAGEPDDPRPPRATVRLRGFQVTPDYADLDGDGRSDFVVTTIDIDSTNVMAAIMRGRVVARTRAFRNRSAAGKDWFPSTPDAEVESEIGVRIRFTYAGAIEVRRSFTILPTGDLDGDGKKDLVIRMPDDRLAVRRGTADGVWSREPSTSLGIPAVGASPEVEGRTADLTGDKKDDVVLLYRAGPGEKDRLVVVPGS